MEILLGFLRNPKFKLAPVEGFHDFLRDFRGDTVHPSTMMALEQMGLSDRFARISDDLLRERGNDVDDLATVIVPLGGGGLISGTAIAVKMQRPDVRVIGVNGGMVL